ncbi:Mitochondrial tRNAs modification protein [Teratosphaeriaceae sp. CCFEE 6253]|nr:Mitochondrial tRNAs modification protein [Teratosphaeriaceae sp. CCFEE 6253]
MVDNEGRQAPSFYGIYTTRQMLHDALKRCSIGRCQDAVVQSTRSRCFTSSQAARTSAGGIPKGEHRTYRVLAIETSCDDTSVAAVTARKFSSQEDNSRGSQTNHKWTLETHFHERVTANNDSHTGIHPLVALDSHRANTAPLVQKALRRLRDVAPLESSGAQPGAGGGGNGMPDLVAVTRGPGMRSNLAVGLHTAKGVAVALDVPLVGVHHMQAHALTPRLTVAMANEEMLHANPESASSTLRPLEPSFPFLSLLVSGGHTMLMDSVSLTQHHVLADSHDIALGQYLDKAARAILPSELLKAPYGRALEEFAWDSARDGDDTVGYAYSAPHTQQGLLEARTSEWGWTLTPPLVERKGGESKQMAYSFTGLLTFVERLASDDASSMDMDERRALAREVQRVAFEHLASRLMLFLTSPAAADWRGDTLVVSGGVAANRFLRHVLRSILDVRGFAHIKLAFPPIELATDNALMIAWAGIEMYDAGFSSALDVAPIRKWSMDPTAPDGGILGVGGWLQRQGNEQTLVPTSTP